MNKRVIQSMGPAESLNGVKGVLEQVTREHGNAINWLVGGFLRLQAIPTASLPAPAEALNGQFVWEDAGGTARNLVIYDNGHSYRFTGVLIA